MNLILVEDTHFGGDSDQDHDAEIDLHKDQELIKPQEDVSLNRLSDPLVSIIAGQVLDATFLLLPVQHECPKADNGDRDDTKYNIAEDEALSLL